MSATTRRLMMCIWMVACAAWIASATAHAAERAAQKRQRTPANVEALQHDESLWKLIVTATADPDSGPPPLKVKFTSEVYEGNDAVNPKYTWDFGDDTPKVHQQNPTHVYKKPGEYKAVVKVVDAKGRPGSDDVSIEVEKPEAGE